MADVWTAVADKTRRQILGMLKNRSMTAGEISDCFTLSKPSISHHLEILQETGLIDCEKDGQRRIYTVNMTIWQGFIEFVAKMTSGENCCRPATEPEKTVKDGANNGNTCGR
jgi:ArsR family transcriptional regulator, arsenate/arsenite/antimonite-responsive transcriptional repressor